MTDDETWVEGDHANTLNSFDAGDVRTTHAIVAKTASTLQAQHGRGFAINAEMAAGGQLIPSVLASFYCKGGSQQGFVRDDNVSPTLMTESGVGIASPVKIVETFPIDDGRDLEKHQNGTGIGAAGDPAYTIDRQQRPAVAYSIREDATAGNFSATEIDAARCLQKHQPSVQSHHAQTFVAEQMSVRRLTPTECERLMGWPDEWTAPEGVKAPDSKRYAACGDGIVAPVAFWIADRIRMIEGEA